MITRVENGLTYTQTFDAENRLVSVTVSPYGQTTQFIYDGDGNMVKKIKPDGSKTLYIGGIYEVDKTSGGTVTKTTTYYPAAGAMRINSTLYYVLKDHLGSASVVTNSSGVTVGEQRYYPYGETRLSSGTIYTDKLFTGQRDVGLGIYHYGARFYSPYLNHFTQPDSIVPDPSNPQSLNRYSYVLNNPVRYNDPSGHMEYDVNDEGAPNCKLLGTCPKVYGPPKPPTPCTKCHDPHSNDPSDESTIDPIIPKDGFTGFWELDKLDGYGLRLDFSGWVPSFPLFGGDLAFDLIYNKNSNEIDLLPSTSGLIGGGEGGDVSIAFLAVYDAPNNAALEGNSFGAQANLTAVGGIQVAYSYSDTSGWTGHHAQVYAIGPSVGAQISLSGAVGRTWSPILSFP